MAIGRINASLSGVQPGGLAKIVPTSVAVGSGSGSVDSNGNVTFSGASSVSLNGCFSSSYQNYRIVMNLSSVSADMSVHFRLRTSGTDNSSSSYYVSIFATTNWTTSTFSSYNSTTSTQMEYILASRSATGIGDLNIDINSPFASQRTSWSGTGISGNESRTLTGFFNNTTSFDGISILPTTGNITGTIRVYGYAQ